MHEGIFGLVVRVEADENGAVVHHAMQDGESLRLC